MIKAADLQSGQTIIRTDRPGFDAVHHYGTVAGVQPVTDHLGVPSLEVTFTEAWATTVILRPADEIFTA